ncbi:helix-turn-helix transcriptional regulator [Paenibacillus sp. NPDC058071]|uniref:helix-turn-helix transcriptional regulator n=1 Tax=Paenibacillus sp. NPDC058071 TaxID=3346326 RepID=UPI0036D9B6FB
MSVIEFAALPLPHYIYSGFSVADAGQRYPERYAIGDFSLIVVQQGSLYIGEEGREYEVSEGHALVLRPDLHHYPTACCLEKTALFWVHFHTQGDWQASKEELGQENRDPVDWMAEHENNEPKSRLRQFRLSIPTFVPLIRPDRMYSLLRELNELESMSHIESVQWQQQLVFQQTLQQLAASRQEKACPSGEDVADRAASYLRKRFRQQISAKELGEALQFHPVYIARCMQKHFGCSPMEYLLRYRLEQARRLLLHTDAPILHIAEEVGFQQAAYFTACFGKREGLTPREYRQRFTDAGRIPPSRY